MKRETLLNYAKKQFHAEPNYLWNNFPRYAVLRHHDDGDKWFAIVMNRSEERRVGKECRSGWSRYG